MTTNETRFDFNTKVETGTIKELLVEIKNEIKRESEEEITFKSLKPTGFYPVSTDCWVKSLNA